MLYQLTATAAVAALNADVLAGSTTLSKPSKNVPRPRRIYGVGLTGSTAAGDCAVELRAQGKPLATVYNAATGAPGDNRQVFPVNKVVPAGADFEIICVDAANANPIYVILIMDE